MAIIDPEDQELVCEWKQNPHDDFWETSCGNTWVLIDGMPTENGMNFCPMCWRRLAEQAKGEE